MCMTMVCWPPMKMSAVYLARVRVRVSVRGRGRGRDRGRGRGRGRGRVRGVGVRSVLVHSALAVAHLGQG